ncbi:MAG: hypothetical protein NZ870_01980 [bacterium]|nr:hypothetical protein [bacterium]
MNTLIEFKKLAKLISSIESNPYKREFKKLLDIKPFGLKIGITGSFASGKSTLIGNIIKELNSKIAVIAVDPENTKNNGAFLGDRMRIQTKVDATKIFLRSFTTNKLLGSLSIPAILAIKVFDMNGFEYIFIETSGSSQQDTFIKDICDILIYVINPGADDFSLIKSGCIELADIIAVTHQDEPNGKRFLEIVKDAFGNKAIGVSSDSAIEVVYKIKNMDIKPSNKKLKKLYSTLILIDKAIKNYNENK